MSGAVLIINRRVDARTSPVESELIANGATVRILAIDDLFQGGKEVCYRIGAGCEGVCSFPDARTGEPLSTEDFKSVWAQDAALPENPALSFTQTASLEETLSTIGRSEAFQMARSVLGVLDHRCLFLPEIMKRVRTSPIFSQQVFAKQAGFQTPPTYGGRRPRDVADAWDVSARTVLHYQPLSPSTLDVYGRLYVTVARFIDADRTFALSNIKGPAIFSIWPPFKRRLYAIVMQEDVYAVELRPKDTTVDPDVTDIAYQYTRGNLSFDAVELPVDAKESCLRYMHASGLSYAALDFLENEKPCSGFTFLAAGIDGHLGIFHQAGFPVYRRLVDWLKRGRGAG